MIAPILEQLAAGSNLSRRQAGRLIELFMSGEATDAQIGAALMAIRIKGESADELAGLAEAMRARAIRVRTRHTKFLDTAGTGGDGANTFNISTAAAFVIAAAGLPVAKHGNRAASSRSGSADVLTALGVRIDVPIETSERCLDELGICFLHAPLYHPATRRVAEVRRQLGVRTAFNMLGPLTNPARAPRQIIGVCTLDAVERVALASATLGAERAWVVHGDGLDEITVTGPTVVVEVRRGRVDHRFTIEPELLGLRRRRLVELQGGAPEQNAALIRGVLEGEVQGAPREIVLLNAAAGLVVGDLVPSLSAGLALASRTVDSGDAIGLLDGLRAATSPAEPALAGEATSGNG